VPLTAHRYQHLRYACPPTSLQIFSLPADMELRSTVAVVTLPEKTSISWPGQEYSAAAAEEMARGSAALSLAGIASLAPGKRWLSSQDLRLSMAQPPGAPAQLAPGGSCRLRLLASAVRRSASWRGRTIRNDFRLKMSSRDRGTRSPARNTASRDSEPQP
jgi:hypothetical protein